MIQELAWYIESGRFTGIVEELEEKAASYAASLAAGGEDVGEREEEFRTLCRWHMKKSGWRADEAETMDIEAEFLDGAELNREALNRFEKEVIKAHLYQKHLWEFMGTTGSMTVISKSAMSQDGYDYSAYLPIEQRRNMPQKNPLSRLLKEHPAAVPIYQYLDGSVSTEYDSDRAAARFDVLKDKSGFDWSSEGWDPNYEVEKNGWHGEYSPDGIWTLVHEDKPTAQVTPCSAAKSTPPLELIRDGDGAILYDPGRSLLSLALRVWLLEDGSVYGAEKTDVRKTAELIRNALGRMGAKNITAVCAGAGKKSGGARMTAAYRAALGELVSPDAKPKTAAEAEESRRKFHAEIQAEEAAIAGRQLFRAVEAAVRSGAKGADAVQSVRNRTVRIPLSLYDEGDRTALGLTEADGKKILSYDAPEEKRAAFSATALGLLKEERLLATGGISRSDIIGMAYAYAVHGKTPEETVSVETTLAQLCSDPDINLRCDEAIEESTLAQLEEAYKSIPRQANTETQRAVDAAVKSAMRNFAAIRMSTGMTPKEAVEAAVRIAGGKTEKPRAIPHDKIEYVTPRMSAADDGTKRIFSDIPLEQLVQEAAGQPPLTKEVDIQTVITQVEENGDGTAYNLLSAEERGAWYESEAFKESGLSVEQAELLAKEELERLSQNRRLEETAVISWETALDEQYGLARRQNLDKTAFVRIVPSTTRVTAEEAAKQLNRQFAGKDAAKKTGGRTYDLLSEEERKEFYRTEEFKESGLTEKEADGLIMAYAGQGRTSAAARVLFLDALLFRKAVRRARKDKRSASPEEIMVAAMTQGSVGRAYNLLSEKERKEFYRTEEFKESGLTDKEADGLIMAYAGQGRTSAAARVLFLDALLFRKAVRRARKDRGKVPATSAMPAEYDKGQQKTADAFMAVLERAVIGESEEAVEPFSVWMPRSDGTPAPKPAAAVRAEDAVQTRKSLLARKGAGLTVEQDGSAHNSLAQTQWHPDTARNSFTATDRMSERAEISSPELTERRNARKFAHSDRQNAGTGGNFFPEADRMLERTEIPSRQMTERQNARKFAYSGRQDVGTRGNFFPGTDGTPEQSEISPHQLTGHQNAREYLSQDRQVAETRGNSIPRTRQSAGRQGNVAVEKRTGTAEAARDIITEDEWTAQDAEARRMERMNAAYERDRAALAKTDPAFTRGTFRDIGHAEGSGETDGQRQLSKKTHMVAKRIVKKLNGNL